MKKINKALVIATCTLFATGVSAIRNGTDVSQDEYKDYLVQIHPSSESLSSCAGTLINGRYIVTARQCVEASSSTGTGWQDDTVASPSTTSSFDIYQTAYYGLSSTDYDMTSYSAGQATIHTPTTAHLEDYVSTVKSLIETHEGVVYDDYIEECFGEQEDYPEYLFIEDEQGEVTCYDLGSIVHVEREVVYTEFMHDTVVIDLGETLTQTSMVKFGNIIDPLGGENPVTGEGFPASAISDGSSVEFYGWGKINPNGSDPELLQKMTFVWSADDFVKGQYVNAEDEIGFETWVVDYYDQAQLVLDVSDNVTAMTGDAGGPLIYEDQVFAFMQGFDTGLDTNSAKQIEGFTHYLANLINDLNTITKLSSDEASADWSFDIQNLVSSSAIDEFGVEGEPIQLELSLEGSETVFAVDSYECSLEELAIGEYCTVEISALTEGEELIEGTLNIDFGSGVRSIPLTLNASADNDDDENIGDGDNGEIGGGSTGTIILFILCLILLARKFTNLK